MTTSPAADLFATYTNGLLADIRREERRKIIDHLRDRLRLARQARQAAVSTPASPIAFYTAGYADALATAIEAIEA